MCRKSPTERQKVLAVVFVVDKVRADEVRAHDRVFAVLRADFIERLFELVALTVLFSNMET